LPGATKVVAALPGLATLALAAATAIGDAVFGQDGEILVTLLVSIEGPDPAACV
jgi:hypothetical protein